MRQLVNLLIWAMRMMVTHPWLAFVLAQVPVTRSRGGPLRDYLLDVVADVAANAVEALPGLVLVAVIVVLAREHWHRAPASEAGPTPPQ